MSTVVSVNPHPTENPAWWDEMQASYEAGEAHCFLFHWATSDWVRHGIGLRAWIELNMLHNDCTVFYSRASGFTFGTGPEAARWKQNFIIAAGLTLPAGMPTLPGQPAPQVRLEQFREPAVALPLLDRVLRNRDLAGMERHPALLDAEEPEPFRLTVVVDFVESLVPSGEWSGMNDADRTLLVSLLTWAGTDGMDNGHPIFLIARNAGDVHSDLRSPNSGVRLIEVPNPAQDEREAYVELLESKVAAANPEHAILAIPRAQVARLTSGMRRKDIEDLFLRGRRARQPLTTEMIMARKREIMAQAYGEVLEPWNPQGGFEQIGGMEQIKEWFRKEVIRPFQDGNFQRVPMGALMSGPPGTGKSAFARALAYELGINCVKFDPAKIFGQYVGQSERNLRLVLTAILDLAPSMVFMEELDQTGANRSEGGDAVSGRVFGMLIDFMAEPAHRGKLVWLGATNRPDLIDAAFKREGRMDVRIPFLPPVTEERNAILEVLMARLFDASVLVPFIADRDHHAVAEATDGWTGAQLEALVRKAWTIFVDSGGCPLGHAFDQALKRFRPNTRAGELMTMIALAECNDLDLLPLQYRERAADLQALETEIEAKEPTPTADRRARRL